MWITRPGRLIEEHASPVSLWRTLYSLTSSTPVAAATTDRSMPGGTPAARPSSARPTTSGGTRNARAHRSHRPAPRPPLLARTGPGRSGTRSAGSSWPTTGSMFTAGGCLTWCWATPTRCGCTGCPRSSMSRRWAART